MYPYMNVKKIYGFFLQHFVNICGYRTAKEFDAMFRFRRSLNLRNPKSLADKVAYIELFKQSPLASMCTDKYAVREYISQRGYGDILIPVVGGPWEQIDDIDFALLPSSFVLKATHGCKMNFVVPNKEDMDMHRCRHEMLRWLNTTYGRYSLEPHYESIPHRIYAEEYLGEMSQLVDYKFHCLNGVPQFVLAISGRKADGDKAMKATLDLFDMQWNWIPAILGNGGEIAGCGEVKKPSCFDKMVEIATALSKEFDFVRVDLYERKGQVLFGELTFSPATCVFPYIKEDFLLEMGERLTI